jgi:hypothetical protein
MEKEKLSGNEIPGSNGVSLVEKMAEVSILRSLGRQNLLSHKGMTKNAFCQVLLMLIFCSCSIKNKSIVKKAAVKNTK